MFVIILLNVPITFNIDALTLSHSLDFFRVGDIIEQTHTDCKQTITCLGRESNSDQLILIAHALTTRLRRSSES